MTHDRHIWNAGELLARAAAGLKKAELALRREQAVRGLDALSEIELHPLLASGLREHALGVLREQPYPGVAPGRRKRAERSRCDLVLLPSPGLKLRDPVEELIKAEAQASTLFAHVEPAPAPGTISSREAYWLEVKCVGQHTYTHGVPGPNRSYSSEIIHAHAEDLAKLAQEASIERGGLLVVLFTEGPEIATHDLAIALGKAADKGLPLRSPESAGFEILDRIGNTWCELSLIEISPVR
ncbi:MAG: hypothetical protein GC200_09640 [Tepidisphaera sp.]|nr:hypothetical protein [Tepidisphaera sp.]